MEDADDGFHWLSVFYVSTLAGSLKMTFLSQPGSPLPTGGTVM